MDIGIPKPTLMGTSAATFSTDGEAVTRYFLDLEGIPNDKTQNILAQAMGYMPQIGSTEGYQLLPAGPTIDQFGVNRFSRRTNQLRVSAIQPESAGHPQKFIINVIYKARPQPTIEMGSSLTQQTTDTYLTGPTTLDRKQMVLEWTAPKSLTLLSDDLKLPKAPVSMSVFRFASAVRISSTFYADEASQNQLAAIQLLFTNCLNIDPLFYGVLNFGTNNDVRNWICTAINQVSYDGGYSQRLTAEWLYNSLGWDTVATYRFNNKPAILTQAVVDGLFKALPVSAIPAPYLPSQGGGGRWPQYRSVRMQNLVSWISQGSVIANGADIQRVLSTV